LAVLFCLVLGVEAVAHERLSSPAFDPLAGFETRRFRVNQRYLQNTLEQFIVFAVGLFGLAAHSPDGSGCERFWRLLWSGYLRGSPFGLAAIAAPRCAGLVRQAWRSA
jgi:hypothetical protein